MLRPDLVDVWIFRVRTGGRDGQPDAQRLELLLLRRSMGRTLPGLWQCVSGSLEPNEPVVAGALRELEEETGIGLDSVEAIYHLDQVNQFFEPTFEGIVSAAVFAVRIRQDVEPRRSHEHDDHRWLTPDDARTLAVWPAYRESITRIEIDLADPDRARWFELRPDGTRAVS